LEGRFGNRRLSKFLKMIRFDTIKIGLRNMSYLTMASLSSQILGFLFVIYVARTLGPEEFGIFNTVGAFVGLFAFMTLTGYQKVLIRESAGQLDNLEDNIRNIFALKMLLCFFSICSVVVCSFLTNYEYRIIFFIFLYSFTLLFNDVTGLLHVVFYSHNQMKYVAFSGIVQRLLYITPTSVCIYFGGGVEFMIILFTLSTMLNAFINYHFVKKKFSIKLDLKLVKHFVLEKRLFKQAFIFSLLGFIGFLYSKIDIAMISWFLDQKSVGLYSAAYKLIQPVELLTGTLSVSFFPLAVARFKEKKAMKAKKLFIYCFFIALIVFPVALIISLFSKDIMKLLYGSAYSEAHLVLRYLIWIIPLVLIAKPFAIAIEANHHEKALIIPNILRAVSNVLLNYLLVGKYGYMGIVYSTIITYSWCIIFVNFGYQYFVLKRAGNIE